MNIFEIVMLLCFGLAWPLSVYKSYPFEQWFGYMIKAFKGSDLNLVISGNMLAGKNIDSSGIPENIHIVNDIPARTLFKECRLLISHGGGNVVHDGLASGTPQVIVTGKDYERYYNGVAVMRNGAGVCLEQFPADAKKFYSICLSTMNSSSIKANSEKLAQLIGEHGGARKAVEVIEEYLKKAKSVNN